MKGIYQVEVCSFCNLRCSYCPHSASKRQLGLMSRETFAKCLQLHRQIGQDWIRLHNFGEPLLHPDLCEYVRMARDRMRDVVFSTNGVLLTREMAVKLKDAGLTKLTISAHSPGVAAQAVRNCKGLDLLDGVSDVFEHDFAGTSGRHPELFFEKWLVDRRGVGCEPFVCNQNVVILWDGSVNSCCMDMEALGKLGHVDDPDVLSLKPAPFALCKTCHWSQRKRTLQLAYYFCRLASLLHGNVKGSWKAVKSATRSRIGRIQTLRRARKQ